MSENLTVNLKVRMAPRDDDALVRVAGRKRQAKGAIARAAIVEFLEREEAYPGGKPEPVKEQSEPVAA